MLAAARMIAGYPLYSLFLFSSTLAALLWPGPDPRGQDPRLPTAIHSCQWTDITAGHPHKNDIIQATVPQNDITLVYKTRNDIIVAPPPKNDNIDNPHRGLHSPGITPTPLHDTGPHSPITPIHSCCGTTEGRSILRATGFAHFLATTGLSPTLADPFQKLRGSFCRFALPSLSKLEHSRRPPVGIPTAPRRPETQQSRPTSGHGTIAFSRKTRNRAQRALNGNISCPHCNCDLYNKTYSTIPSKFRTPALQLSNGMLVHHFLWCQEHLSVWFYRRGVRHYQVYYGNKAHNLYNHIHTARAASGKPGGHDSQPRLLQHFFALHCLDNRYTLDRSGHESRSASGVKHPHDNCRSLEARHRRHELRNERRRRSRREYRQWISSVLEGGKFTLAQPRRPLKRVTNSPDQLRRAYSSQRRHPTIGSRAALYRYYIQPSLLDMPSRHLSWRPSNNLLTVATWNIESLIGLGKHQALAEFVTKKGLDILCLQETKSTASNEIFAKGGKYLLSGTPTDPAAGVGFFVPAKTLPLVFDFIPFSFRVAALLLRTQPLPTIILTIYAPSMLQDSSQDLIRKQKFWDELPKFLQQLPRPATIVVAGDFNARIVQEDLSTFSEYIGPAVLPTDSPFDETTNYAFLVEFLISEDFLLASSKFKRPYSKLITYKEINSSPNATPFSPNNTDFAVIDHVLIHERSFHQLRSVSSQITWQLPWFHRHYPVTFTLSFDKFAKARPKPQPRLPLPSTPEDRHSYITSFPNAPFSPLRSHPATGAIQIYTDGSCPDQNRVTQGNPAGWAFTFTKNFEWHDSYGPVGQGLSFTPVGSNNTAELQALIEALDYICRHPGKFRNLPIDLYTDSQLVHQLCHDIYLPHTHMQLVEQLRSYITRARTMFDLAILKVRGHAGIAGNTRADKLAFTGVTSSSMVGRHSFPPRPLLPLLFPPTSPTLPTSQDLEAQVLVAASSLQPANPEQYQKEYLSSKAKTLIKQIDNTPFQDYETVQKLRKAVRKQVRKDKRQHLCDQLLQDSKGPPSKQWATLKFVRKPYTPKTQGILQSNGKICSKAQKAETLAKYLSDEVWGHQEDPPMDPTPLYPVADMTSAPFTEAELDAALHRMRHKKAPGPNSIPVELWNWKYSPRHFRLSLLAHYNHVFSQATAPNNWAPAVVIMIYKGKKKDPKSPSS